MLIFDNSYLMPFEPTRPPPASALARQAGAGKTRTPCY